MPSSDEHVEIRLEVIGNPKRDVRKYVGKKDGKLKLVKKEE